MIQADSGNERYKTCTGAIREAPRRKGKMKKKTIAILLVLVIGMVGVFAASYDPSNISEKTLKLTTEVIPVHGFKITTTSIDDATNENDKKSYAYFSTGMNVLEQTSVTPAGDATVDQDGYVSSTLGDGAYLTVANNSTTAIKIFVKASPFKMPVPDGGTASNLSEINYRVTINSVDTISTGSFNETEVMLVQSAGDGLVIKSEAISVALNANDYNSATASSGYLGIVYFNISSN
jgi:hypothetical protein